MLGSKLFSSTATATATSGSSFCWTAGSSSRTVIPTTSSSSCSCSSSCPSFVPVKPTCCKPPRCRPLPPCCVPPPPPRCKPPPPCCVPPPPPRCVPPPPPPCCVPPPPPCCVPPPPPRCVPPPPPRCVPPPPPCCVPPPPPCCLPPPPPCCLPPPPCCLPPPPCCLPPPPCCVPPPPCCVPPPPCCVPPPPCCVPPPPCCLPPRPSCNTCKVTASRSRSILKGSSRHGSTKGSRISSKHPSKSKHSLLSRRASSTRPGDPLPFNGGAACCKPDPCKPPPCCPPPPCCDPCCPPPCCNPCCPPPCCNPCCPPPCCPDPCETLKQLECCQAELECLRLKIWKGQQRKALIAEKECMERMEAQYEKYLHRWDVHQAKCENQAQRGKQILKVAYEKLKEKKRLRDEARRWRGQEKKLNQEENRRLALELETKEEERYMKKLRLYKDQEDKLLDTQMEPRDTSQLNAPILEEMRRMFAPVAKGQNETFEYFCLEPRATGCVAGNQLENQLGAQAAALLELRNQKGIRLSIPERCQNRANFQLTMCPKPKCYGCGCCW